jgi:hypothetical protein
MNMYGIKGLEDGQPVKAFQVHAESGAQAVTLLEMSEEAEGLDLSEPLEILTGLRNRERGVWYAGEWPWPGKAA